MLTIKPAFLKHRILRIQLQTYELSLDSLTFKLRFSLTESISLASRDLAPCEEGVESQLLEIEKPLVRKS